MAPRVGVSPGAVDELESIASNRRPLVPPFKADFGLRAWQTSAADTGSWVGVYVALGG